MPSFTTTLLLTGNNVGIEVPEDVVLSFGAGKRVPVIVTIAGYSYPSTIAVMGGQYLLPMAAEHRKAAGVAGSRKSSGPSAEARPQSVRVLVMLAGSSTSGSRALWAAPTRSRFAPSCALTMSTPSRAAPRARADSAVRRPSGS